MPNHDQWSVRQITRTQYRREHGTVTAEAAIVMPLMALFALSLCWLISIVVAHIQAVDAARDAAREIARGGDVGAATSRARDTAPTNAHVSVVRRRGLATVIVTVTVDAPGWLVVPWPDVRVDASSSVATEGAVDAS